MNVRTSFDPFFSAAGIFRLLEQLRGSAIDSAIRARANNVAVAELPSHQLSDDVNLSTDEEIIVVR